MTAIELWSLPLIAVIGLCAGLLGGLLGVGGSIVLIPGLTLVLGRDQHLYQAAAMAVNVAVSLPAALRHRWAGAVLPGVLTWLLPAGVAGVLIGVWVSNLSVFEGDAGGRWLGRLLAVFLLYVAAVNLRAAVRGERAKLKAPVPGERSSPPKKHIAPAAAGVGGAMGLIGGLLGIGGGVIAVPMQQTLLRLPLRNAIANSSAVIVVTAGLGAVYKNATLWQHGDAARPLSWTDGLLLAACAAPTAWLGGRLGAGLTHTLPLRAVRVAFVGLMVVAAWRMW